MILPTHMRSSFKNKKQGSDINLTEQRIKGLYHLIKSRKKIKRFEIQESNGWGDGIYERAISKAIQKFPEISYDRKEHLIKYVEIEKQIIETNNPLKNEVKHLAL